MWWDNETDGELMYPEEQKHLTAEDYIRATEFNPNEAAARGHWSDPEFLANVSDLNPHLRHTQFADFHGHGWVYRAVFKKDRQGKLLDWKNDPLGEVSSEQLQAAVAPPSARRTTRRQVPPRRAGPPDGHPHGKGNALHRLSLLSRQSRQHEAVLRSPRRDRNPMHRLPRHRRNESLVEKVEQQIDAGQAPRLPTSGPAAPEGGTNLLRCEHDV